MNGDDPKLQMARRIACEHWPSAHDFAERDAAIGHRMMVMVPCPIELVITDADKQAACDLIGNDSYGQPVWTIETISPENRVVQAFARHRLAGIRDHLKGPTA